jgi:hypothetical protein
MVPLANNTALGIAILSYDGQLNFGLDGDYDALADIDVLADELQASVDEIVTAAGAPVTPLPGGSQPSRGGSPLRAAP